jgi:hypothetical protein
MQKKKKDNTKPSDSPKSNRNESRFKTTQIRAIERGTNKVLYSFQNSFLCALKMVANQKIFLKLSIEEPSKSLFGFLKKPTQVDFEAIVDKDTIVTHIMPECPLMDGSLAFSEKFKITIDLLHF